jgi:hypothetical protein
MPSELTQSVRTAINNFLSVKTSDDHGEIAIDVLRAIRDEAALLMEKQTIFDTFDSDPMKFYDGDIQLMKQIERIKVSGLAFLSPHAGYIHLSHRHLTLSNHSENK